MGIVILTRQGQEHRHAAARLIAGLGDRVDAVIVDDPPPRGAVDSARRYVRRYSAPQLASRTLSTVQARMAHREQRRREQYERILFPGGDDGVMPGADRLFVVPGHNHAECHDLLDRFRPDLIAVYGTGILRDTTIGKADVILNMHTGISPRYRGTDTVFWPLHNEEPEWVGVTIHVLDAGIDSGPILRVGRPRFEIDDDEFSLFAKCVRVGADLYVDAAQDALEGRLEGEPQDLSEGRNYRGVDRTATASRRVERLVREGLIRDHAVAQRARESGRDA